MTPDQSDRTSRADALSPASQHALTLSALQGFQPPDWFITMLEALDAGTMDEEEARRQIKKRLALRTVTDPWLDPTTGVLHNN